MGKRKRSAAEEVTRRAGGLEDAFPASPSRPPRFGLYCRNRHGAFTYHAFVGAYAAQRFVEIVTEGMPYKWLNCATIEAENGVRLSSTTDPNPKPSDFQHFPLEDIIEHERSREEDLWQVPEPYRSMWERLPHQSPATELTDEERSRRRSREPREARPDQPARPRRDASNITVSVIAEQMNLEPGKARAALRKSGETKPAAGWKWPETEVDRIKAVIREHLK